MAFVDECTLYVASGRGGDGLVSMHSEPYKARGGPDGGSGGNGGSVILEVTAGIHDLSWLSDHPHQRAAPGANGRSTRRDGASGKDLVLPVPDGTVVFDDEGFVADLRDAGALARIDDAADASYSRAPSPRICTSGCGVSTATFFSRSTSASVSGIRSSFQ